MRTLILAIAAAFLVPQAPASPTAWQIDPAHTSAQFAAKHMLVSTVRGTLGKVTGTVDYDGTSVPGIKADVTIDVAGLSTANENRDKDLRSPNFFDVEKFPTITFKSKRTEAAEAGKFRLVGDLTIHGVTKEVTLNCDGPSPILKTPQGQRVGASAALTINRRDFGLQYSRLVEAAPVVSDEIQINIDIEATRK